MVKAYKLKDNTEAQLIDELNKTKVELAKVRVGKVATSTQAKLTKIKGLRKDIARILTLINMKRKAAKRVEFAKKSKKPVDLRKRLTRAIRKRLSPVQQKKKTLREKKREANFPLRKYAIMS